MFNNYKILDRVGYGSNFNNIYIDYENKIIKKECNNSYGKTKMTNEIKLYNFIIENKINFPIPKIYNFYDNGYTMEYLNNFYPLFKIFKTLNKEKIINKINVSLLSLHSFKKKYVEKDIYYFHLKIEIENKIQERIKIIAPIIKKYDYIQTINNKPIIPFEILMEKIKNSIYKIVSNNDEYYFVPIHGDCQFNNIMYNKDTEDIVFIDPRGYYGDSSVFGISDYDYAKVKFALSGYDEFDNRIIENLHIKDNNIDIFIDFLDQNVINDKSLSTLLMITIWMGNAHCFASNENKAIYSYFIALYLGSMFFS